MLESSLKLWLDSDVAWDNTLTSIGAMMLKIGNYSRIAGVSLRLLHYYEELGWFQPAYIDRESAYRYYKSEQIINLNKILALKDLGLTLQEIKLYKDEETLTMDSSGCWCSFFNVMQVDEHKSMRQPSPYQNRTLSKSGSYPGMTYA